MIQQINGHIFYILYYFYFNKYIQTEIVTNLFDFQINFIEHIDKEPIKTNLLQLQRLYDKAFF